MFESVARFFQAGGPMMWVILSVLAAALAVMVERLYFYLRTARGDADALAAGVAARLNENDTAGVIELLEGDEPARNLMRRAFELDWEGARPDEIRAGVEELAIREVPRYNRRLSYLGMLANVATLAGLLGTIFGLQQSFSALAAAEAAQKASVLAAGISQAMNTTAFGLMVAMPALVAHTRLSSMATRRTEACDAAVIKSLNYFEARAANAPAVRNHLAS